MKKKFSLFPSNTSERVNVLIPKQARVSSAVLVVRYSIRRSPFPEGALHRSISPDVYFFHLTPNLQHG